ncbi:efflux RND transporter periplasmic adaptor subunit [Falsiroseomonas oryzae]|uniref:efflux RND transporter periplasmic adaptor subunit n=1 Tax=Falsiroseomonas oryzae TaxID=2766473 RepID=UPI0022EA544D|nr:efflux RND transporter periplasmic adaptor subunit [Roseomonas sp. MO-31]
MLLLAALSLPVAAQPAPLLQDTEFDCLMDAAQRVKLGASVTGLIRAVNVNRGDVVRRGQVLAQLASEVEEANAALARVRARNDSPVASAEQRAEYARRRAGRLERLRATNAVSEREYDEAATEARVAALTLRDAQMNLEAARAELLRAEEQVAQRQILSPIDGIVVERHLSGGEYLHEQAQLLTLAQIDPLHVEVYLPVAFFGQIATGDVATVMPEAPVGGQYRARVSVVDRVMDAASGTFGVRLLLANPDLALPAGLRCRIRFRAPD